ncbi:hypothetical protein [Sorangium cellulosum]|uniref:hypothetical protein n=1 Tax=Sorangium cellulosum TaxID=56 RepID=UPI001F1DC9C2|nr:hypothetical protein [Sorangium cellulosum]
MELRRELVIGALDLLLVRLIRDAEQRVIAEILEPVVEVEDPPLPVRGELDRLVELGRIVERRGLRLLERVAAEREGLAAGRHRPLRVHPAPRSVGHAPLRRRARGLAVQEDRAELAQAAQRLDGVAVRHARDQGQIPIGQDAVDPGQEERVRGFQRERFDIVPGFRPWHTERHRVGQRPPPAESSEERSPVAIGDHGGRALQRGFSWAPFRASVIT